MLCSDIVYLPVFFFYLLPLLCEGDSEFLVRIFMHVPFPGPRGAFFRAQAAVLCADPSGPAAP